jgi:hypothetical protein
VLEPAAGSGHFLSAVPVNVPAFGIEIDPERAEQARVATGRPIITGDFRTVEIPGQPSAIISNPPFSLVAAFLDRAYSILPDGGIAGFLMPTHLLSYSRTVTDYAERWSITVDAIPRDIFRAVVHFPISFAVFSKDRLRRLVGLSGFAEAADVRNMDGRFRAILNRSVSPQLWRDVVMEALRILGGQASLAEIYAIVQGSRRCLTRFWREKVRQTLARYCERVQTGVYRLPHAA